MNLLTNGFVNNYGRPFGPSEQFEADIIELGLKGFSAMNRPASRYRSADSGRITEKREVTQLAISVQRAHSARMPTGLVPTNALALSNVRL